MTRDVGVIGGGPTLVGTLVGQSFVNDTLSIAFLALAAGSILYVIVQLLRVAQNLGRRTLMYWGLLLGLEVGGGCTEYGHIIQEVARGDRVTAGQRVARINPDSATNGGVAPHLHLSVMPREYNPDTKMDPIPWLAGALEPPARTIFGPDISNNNGVVDLDQVKAEGFDFVWAKVSDKSLVEWAVQHGHTCFSTSS